MGYATKLEHMNDIFEDENPKKPIDSSQLFYVTSKKQVNQISIALTLLLIWDSNIYLLINQPFVVTTTYHNDKW